MSKTRMPGSMPRADEKFLLDSRRKLTASFNRLAKGRIAGMLDGAFGCFDLPLVSRRRQPSSPSGVILASAVITIKLSELDMYEAGLTMARRHSRMLQNLDALMDRCNKRILDILRRNRIVYRGMGLAELETISRNGGVFGLHHRTMYAAANDFVSFSVDVNAAMVYAVAKGKAGLIVEADVSGMNPSRYAGVKYEARNDISVTKGGRRIYNPYERFGGGQSGMISVEAEVHLMTGSRPTIRKVIILGERTARFRGRLERAVARLEQAQGKRITIKYLPDQAHSWQN